MTLKLNVIISFLISFASFSQQMNNNKLEKALEKSVDSINGYSGYWEIHHQNRQLLCITDEDHNRMRIITPIVKSKILDKDLLLDLLTANFHSSLDVKYAISDEILWSVFIHPLKELSETEVTSAVNQLINAANNFGTTFSSTEMIFRPRAVISEEKENEKEAPKKEPLESKKL